MPENASPTVTRAVIAGPVMPAVGGIGSVDASGEGRLAVGTQVLVVRDHGTELGAELAGTLGLADDVAAEVLAGASPHGLATDPARPEIEVDLRPTDDATDVLVEVTGPGDHHSAEHRYPRVSVVDRVMGILTRSRLDANDTWPHLHAGALVNGEGQAVVVMGISGAGKSTLVANLAATGLHLVNDEQVSLHPAQGLVAGFTRPVAVKPGGERYLPSAVAEGLESVNHTQLVGAAALSSRHRLVGRPALLVFPERSDDDHEVTWEQLSTVEAIEALCANNLDLARSPSVVLAAFAWLATTAPAVTVRYRDVADVVPVLQRLLADPPALETVVWALSEGAGQTAAHHDPGAPLDAPVVAPVEGVMTVRVGDEAMLFHPASLQLLRLNATGADLWATLPWPDLPVDDAELAPVVEFALDLVDRGLVDLFGAPGTIYERAPRLVSRRIRDKVLVSGTDHRVATLEGASAVVWDALAEPGRPHELVRRILADHDDDESHADPDRPAVSRRVFEALDVMVTSGLAFGL
ncbi:MAG: hypothetical protein ABIP03_15835 [Aquihabitans sp.]